MSGLAATAPIYLDHQASTPLADGVLEAISRSFSDVYANPHSDDHVLGWSAAEAVEGARSEVGDAIGADPSEVVFTSGATEANNIAILGTLSSAQSRSAGRGISVVVSAIEHKSVLGAARAATACGADLRIVPVGRDGLIDLDALAAAVDAGTAVVSVGAVNNEIGIVQPLGEIGQICSAAGALLHTDATQALAWRALDLATVNVDLASFSAHKMGGPKGVGALYVAHAAAGRVRPVMHGGGQEGGLRPGTAPTPLIVGFGRACAVLPDERIVERWRSVTDHLLSLLRNAFLNMELNGARSPRHPGNLNVMLPGVPADVLLAHLQPRLAIARGSACTSGMPEPSHVLLAIGRTVEAAECSVRISTGVGTSVEEVARAVKLIEVAAAAAVTGGE